ncbi:ankyrin repeat domain-containing protein [Fluoribacter gormanii]|uniref:Ankyrin repeat n=2 Tax=Fluoribacter gormanii TaxID=464 RepID=A0A377GNL9_9GAMM|nr:ankyrin repeat domain-containing protein [Fluoribacter gormanii]KTD04783.1 ankyrin repeat-containing protein [Fluoribacter gormanii]MCW8470669.1 ankyrin repeat domain-containing protein [Fluoribacter gormanii]SIR17023.1 Ankyrin repeat [Fluoribacter gormanii]STO26214.1 Ribulose-5-phosphate 4-epimerase and related epimerases and aldolases [Fluoribacter gormanii]
MLNHENLIAINGLFMNPQKGTSKGVCYGLSCKYLDALFCNDRDTLYRRLELIERCQENPAELLHKIQIVYDKIKQSTKDNPVLTDEEFAFLEIRPFFESITLQLHPDFYPEIHGLHVMQNYIANHKISAPKQLENAAPKLLHRSYHAKDKQELTIYFEQLKLMLQSCEQVVGFILESDEHAIALSYDQPKDAWALLNADNLIRSEITGFYHQELNSLELAEELYQALNPQIEIEEDEEIEYEPSEYTIFSLNCFGLNLDPTLTSKLNSLCPLPIDKQIISRTNEDNVSIFFLAAQSGDIEAMKVMLPEQYDIDEERYDGETPLSMAVQEGHLEAVKFLIKNGADKNHCNKKGESMLHCAAAMGHSEIIDYLISLDLDIDEEDLNCNTPLISAIYNNKEKSVLSLLTHGADVNVLYKDQFSPLCIAAFIGNPEIIVALINAGANVNYQMEDGSTALDIALSMNNLESAEAIRLFIATNEQNDTMNSISQKAYKDRLLEGVAAHSYLVGGQDKSIAFFDKMPKKHLSDIRHQTDIAENEYDKSKMFPAH